VRVGNGMGFIPGHFLITDQHFIRRGRLGRLIVAVQAAREGRFPFMVGFPTSKGRFLIGAGVDEDAAVVLPLDGGPAEVIGDCGATLVFTHECRHTIRGYENIRLVVISNDLLGGGVDRAEPLDMHQSGFRRLDGGPWDRDQLKKVVTALQEVQRVYIADDDVELRFSSDDETRFRRSAGGSINAEFIRLDITYNLAKR
jgi:hypothetical protein